MVQYPKEKRREYQKKYLETHPEQLIKKRLYNHQYYKNKKEKEMLNVIKDDSICLHCVKHCIFKYDNMVKLGGCHSFKFKKD